VVARVPDHLSQSTCLEMLHPKTDEHANPVWRCTILLKMLETYLSNGKKKRFVFHIVFL